MKVLMVTAEFPPMQGGVGDYTALLSASLVQQGVSVEVVTSRLPGEREASHVDMGYPVHRAVRRWGWGCWGTLSRLARERGADLIHIQYQAAAYGMHPAINLFPRWMRLRGAPWPCVVTFHDLRVPYLFPKAGPLRWRAIVALASGADAAILTNREDYDRLGEVCRTPRYRIPLGPNFAPPPDLPLWSPAEDGNRPFVLCHFGFLNESKGCQDLVEALALVRARGAPRPFVLRIVGGTAGDSDPTNVAFRERLRAQIAARGLEEAVTWTGFLPPREASARLLESDLCVLPYRDGASFRRGTLLIALVHGLPVLTTEPVVPIPALRHGENVWLVRRQDPEALAEAILHLAGDVGLCRRLAQGAWQLGCTFQWPQIAWDTKEVYRAVLGD
ncbi:MAG: glycosyltransferase family 4 protein [Anaerolineae bacterium]|nr:glycosyltransferase family 4 protein [Anaerolineae bacterium]